MISDECPAGGFIVTGDPEPSPKDPFNGPDGQPWSFRCVVCAQGTHTAHAAPGGWHCYRCIQLPEGLPFLRQLHEAWTCDPDGPSTRSLMRRLWQRIERESPAAPNPLAGNPMEWPCECGKRLGDCACFGAGFAQGRAQAEGESTPLHGQDPNRVDAQSKEGK